MSKKTNQKPERQAHRTHSKKYWRDKSKQLGSWLIYSPYNLTRMAKGNPPRRLCILRHIETGEQIEYHAPVELHHLFGNKAETPQEDQTLIECYPWQHAAMDDDRKFKWEFVQWVGFQ